MGRRDTTSLAIRGEKKSQRDEKNEKGRRLECSYGAFSRSFSLSSDADPDRIAAKFKDGVLDVTVKRSAASKPKQVAIKCWRARHAKTPIEPIHTASIGAILCMRRRASRERPSQRRPT